MEMHKKCSCENWQVYPTKHKIVTTFVTTLLLGLVAAVAFLGWKIAGEGSLLKEKAISLSSPWMKETLGALIGLAVVSLYAFFVYNLPKQFRSWGKSVCPTCEKGYMIVQGVGPIKAIFYFFDNFLFQEILVPMFRTITFQHFWRRGYKKKRGLISGLLTFVLQIFLFFGAIPFLIFLLGQDNVIGLVCAIAVLFYIMYTIVARRNKEDMDYQKSVVFLMIPLYYVSMVELFRWAFLFSPEAAILVPDRSDFLFLGVQNFIRTQLFLDLLDTINVVNLEVSGYLFLGATFITRLLLDIAVISLLIKAGVESYRRTWMYYHTGRQVEEVTSKEALFDLENLVVIGNPNKIQDVRGKLFEVMRVLSLVKPYVENVRQMDDNESRIQAQECINQLSGLSTEPYTSRSAAPAPWYRNALSLAVVTAWGFAFVIGIQYFIDTIIKFEIDELMKKAETDVFINDPIGRQELFKRVLIKDPNHDDAMMKSFDNHLKLAELNERVYNYQQAQVDIDDAFLYLRRIDTTPELKKKHQKALLQKPGKAYAIRGRLFFLQSDMERALEELRKRKTQETRRMLFDIQLYNASQNLFTPSAPSYFDQATQELGFDLDYEFLYIQTLLKSLYSAHNKDFPAFISQLQQVIKDQPRSFSPIYNSFANALAHALLRQGEQNFIAAGKLFRTVYNSENAGREKYSALLGMANLYRLQNKLVDAGIILDKILNDENAPQQQKNIAWLNKATLSLQQQDAESARNYITKVISQHSDVREPYRQQILNFLASNISGEQLIDEAQSWNIGISETQHTLCYYYLGMVKLAAGEYDDAATFWRRCIFLNLNALPEVMQAKQELENLQIRFEGQSYQSELFFNNVYLAKLNQLTRSQIKNKINPQQKTIEALEFLLGTKYDSEKIDALQSIAEHGSLKGDKFLQLLKTSLQSDSPKLKIAALNNLQVLSREEGIKIKEAVVAELKSDNELVRRGAVKVLSVFGEVEPLIMALQSDDEFIRRDAGYALAKMKKDATPAAQALQEKLSDKQVTVRDAVFSAIVQIDSTAATPILTKIVKEGVKYKTDSGKKQEDDELRIKALRHLSRNYPKVYSEIKDDVTSMLVKLLTNGQDIQSSRWSALELIRINASNDTLNTNKDMIIQRMNELLKSYDAQTRITSASWYLHLYDYWEDVNLQPAIEVFIKRWQQGGEGDQIAVANSFLLSSQRICRGTSQVLAAALQNNDAKIARLGQKLYLEKIIGRDDLSDDVKKSLINSLMSMLREGKQQKIAFQILKKYKNDDVEGTVPHLLPFVVDSDANIRANILEILDLESGDYEANSEDAAILVTGLDNDPEIQKTVLEVSDAYDISNEKMYEICLSLVKDENITLASSAIRILANFPDKKDEIMPKLIPILQKELGDPYGDDDDDDDDAGNDDDDDDDYGNDDDDDDDAGNDDDDDDYGNDDDDDSGNDDDDDDDYGNDDDDDDAGNDDDDDDDSGNDDDDGDDYGNDDDDDDDDEEEDDELTRQDAALYTVGVLNGVEYLYEISTDYPHLVTSALPTIYEVQEKLEAEDSVAMSTMAKFLNEDDEDTIVAALEEIENVDDIDKSAALPSLKKLQISSNLEIRKLAQKLVLQIEGSKDLKLLMKWLADEDEEIRLAAISALGKTKVTSKNAIAQIAARIADSEEEVRNKASEVIVKIGRPALGYTFKYIKHPKPKVQALAIQTIGNMGTTARVATGKLMKSFISASPQMKTAILQTVAHIATPKERKYVLKPCKMIVQSSKSHENKVLAWTIIARVGLKDRALTSLIAMLEKQPKNQFFIIKNLQEIDAAYTVQYLKQVIRSRYGTIKVITAIRVLEKLEKGAKSAIPVLREMAIDPNPEFSEAAKKALAAIE